MKLNESEKKVLAILKENPYVNQKHIAEQLKLSRPAIANLISKLQDKGYILGKPYMLKTAEYVTCIGSANLDYTFRLEDAIVYKTSNPVKSAISYGGVIRNVADNLSRLNHSVSLMTVVGDDRAGDDVLSNAKKIMEVFACDKLKNCNTGGYYAVIDAFGDMHVGFADMSINKHMDRSWILEHKRHLNLSTWLIADTNVTKEALEALIEYADLEDKKLAIIGVSGPKMKHVPENIQGVEMIICNLDETQSYFKTNQQDPNVLINLWMKKGVKNAIITDGKNGAIYYDGKKIGVQEAYLVDEEKKVDVTGAGDAFSSAVLHGLINGEALQDSIKYGAISASLTIQSKYAVNPNLSINLIKKEQKKHENI